MDPRFHQHVAPPSRPQYQSAGDSSFTQGSPNNVRLSPNPAAMAAPGGGVDPRTGYPYLNPAGQGPPAVSPEAAPHPASYAQGYPQSNMPPPILDPSQLANGMAQMGLQPSPNHEAAVRLPNILLIEV